MTDDELSETLNKASKDGWYWCEEAMFKGHSLGGILWTEFNAGTPWGDEIDKANAKLLENARVHAEEVLALRNAARELIDACHASVRMTGITYTPTISTRFNLAVQKMVDALDGNKTNEI